jgi:hypothetical protein
LRSGANARIIENGERLEVVVRHRLGEAGRIDHDIGTPMRVGDGLRGVADARRILQHDPDRPVAAAGQFADQLPGAVEALVVAHIDACAFGREHPHRRGADAVAAAGDDRDLVLQALLLHALLLGSASRRYLREWSLPAPGSALRAVRVQAPAGNPVITVGL